MKRKYFARGLGLGILVTALLFAFGLLFYKPSLSDEEIKARATLLGMTDTSDRKITSGTSSSSSATSSASSAVSSASSAESSTSAASSAVPATSAEPENTPTSAAETPKPSEEPAPAQNEPVQEEPAQEEPAQPQAPAAEPVETQEPAAPVEPAEPAIPDNPGTGDELRSVTISPQETSLRVSENLYRAGIISDPAGFNKYLEENGYDYNIQTGTYWISPNASYETIAHAITNK